MNSYYMPAAMLNATDRYDKHGWFSNQVSCRLFYRQSRISHMIKARTYN